MDLLEREIVFALALAKHPRAVALAVAPKIARTVRNFPIADFRISFVHFNGLANPEYTFGSVKHSIHNAKTAVPTTDGIDGTFLSRGWLTKLAKATWVGEVFVPRIWNDQDLRKNLREPSKHLATIEEIIWLGGFWHLSIDYDSVIRAHKMAEQEKDIDWRFCCKSNGLTRWINLEVKRRDGDIKALCPDGKPVVDPFADIADKFVASAEDEINVAGITVYGSDVGEVAERAQLWLEEEENCNVDCVIVWNDAAATGAVRASTRKGSKLEELNCLLDLPMRGEEVPIVIRRPREIPVLSNSV